MSASSLVKKLLGELVQNSPTILTWMAATGVFTTVIFAVKATPKALALLEDELDVRYSQYAETKTDTDEELPAYSEWIGIDYNAPTLEWSKAQLRMFNKREIVKYTWKSYIPTAIMGLVTIGCIVGAHKEHLRRNAALVSLYSLTETAFKEYKEKVVETIGKNKELKVRDDISADRIKHNPVGDNEIIFTGKGEMLCYDSMSGRYFKTDIEKVRKAQNELNRRLMSEMFISLNEFYDELGLSHIRLGEEMGWNIDKDLINITFSAQLTEKEEPCLVLNYEVVSRYR